MPIAKGKQTATKDEAVEALDLFTVKRKQGKPTGQYESHGMQYGKASFKKRGKRAMDYVSPGDGGF